MRRCSRRRRSRSKRAQRRELGAAAPPGAPSRARRTRAGTRRGRASARSPAAATGTRRGSVRAAPAGTRCAADAGPTACGAPRRARRAGTRCRRRRACPGRFCTIVPARWTSSAVAALSARCSGRNATSSFDETPPGMPPDADTADVEQGAPAAEKPSSCLERLRHAQQRAVVAAHAVDVQPRVERRRRPCPRHDRRLLEHEAHDGLGLVVEDAERLHAAPDARDRRQRAHLDDRSQDVVDASGRDVRSEDAGRRGVDRHARDLLRRIQDREAAVLPDQGKPACVQAAVNRVVERPVDRRDRPGLEAETLGKRRLRTGDRQVTREQKLGACRGRQGSEVSHSARGDTTASERCNPCSSRSR